MLALRIPADDGLLDFLLTCNLFYVYDFLRLGNLQAVAYLLHHLFACTDDEYSLYALFLYRLGDRIPVFLVVKEGYTVIRYDLIGRGLSERVKSKYAPEDFAVQLKELIDWLVPDGKCILFGTSMGGSILAAFCAMYPGVAQKIVLYAPAGMDNFKPPIYMKLAAVPVLGKRIFKLVMPKSTLARATDELLHQDEAVKDQFVRDLAFTMQYKGYLAGTHASLVNTILKTKEATKYYKKMARQHIPTLVIWGTEDKTMPIYQIDRMAKVLKDAEFVIFEGSGHIFLYDEGERALAHTLPFLNEE